MLPPVGKPRQTAAAMFHVEHALLLGFFVVHCQDEAKGASVSNVFHVERKPGDMEVATHPFRCTPPTSPVGSAPLIISVPISAAAYGF